METKEIVVGDQILVSLAELGDFTATAHKITDKGVLFIFDDYVTSRPMNNKNTNKGGYEKSDLKKWIDCVLLEAFPEEPDTDEQLLLMKERRNRVAYLNNEWEWGWLRNATKEEFSAAYFALVYSDGPTTYDAASGTFGVRPEFWLVR